MRLSMSLVAVAFGAALASPIAGPPDSKKDNGKVMTMGVGMGKCGQDCWNEAAVRAKCDPNTDDDCLCGPFLDAVTSCTSQTCNVGENLAALDLLEPACE